MYKPCPPCQSQSAMCIQLVQPHVVKVSQTVHSKLYHLRMSLQFHTLLAAESAILSDPQGKVGVPLCQAPTFTGVMRNRLG